MYYGSPNKIVTPQYGLGNNKHGYGKGFYLTEDLELAKEWSVCLPNGVNGYVHKFELDTKDLRILDFEKYDVIKGWWANVSYFYIAKEFVKDNIDIEILEELLSLGGLGIQYCIKTECAYSKLKKIQNEPLVVNYKDFNYKHNQRDVNSRIKMHDLINSDVNKVANVFSTLLKR